MPEPNKASRTVAELIKALQQFPPDMPVVVSGYEGGYENMLTPKIEKLEQNPENPYWEGEFQEPGQLEGGQLTEAVVLQRVLRSV